MQTISHETIQALPMLQFPRGWRVKILPPIFPNEGELFRFRLYRRGDCVSVVFWGDSFELYSLLTGRHRELTLRDYRADPRRLWALASEVAKK